MPHADDVLVVDDEAEIVRLISEVLADEGYRVRVAHDGPCAIAAVVATAPALVLLDYTIPGMSGGEILAHLRENGFAELPIVIMSANNQIDRRHLPGATAFLEKPFDLDDLLLCVERFVGPRSMPG